MAKERHLTKEELHEDAFVSGAIRVADYAKRNQKSLIIALVVIILLGLGLRIFQASLTEKNGKAAVLLDRGVAGFEAEEYTQAEELFNQVLATYPHTQAAGYAVYFLAVSYLRTDDYEQAQKYFQKYLDDYGDDPLVSAVCTAGLGRCAEARGEYEKAAEFFREAALSGSEDIWASHHLFQSALCLEKAGKTEEALVTLDLLEEKFPDAREVRDLEFYRDRLELAKKEM